MPSNFEIDGLRYRTGCDTVSCRDALKSIRRAVIIVDRDGGIRYLNPAAESLLGYRLNEVFGWALPALITSRDELWKCIDAGLKHLQGAGKAHEVTLHRRSGGSVRVEINGLTVPATLGNGLTLKEVTAESSPTRETRSSIGEERKMLDARWSKRTTARAAVVLRSTDGIETRGVIRDISHSGLYVETPHPQLVQSCVVVGLLSEDTPERFLYQTAAIVAHRQADGVGVMLPEGAGHIMSALCRSIAPPLRAATG